MNSVISYGQKCTFHFQQLTDTFKSIHKQTYYNYWQHWMQIIGNTTIQNRPFCNSQRAQTAPEHTWVLSSWKPSKKLSNNSSALSMRSAYSPTIQIMAARASGSSRESRFSHSVAITLSYLDSCKQHYGYSNAFGDKKKKNPTEHYLDKKKRRKKRKHAYIYEEEGQPTDNSH